MRVPAESLSGSSVRDKVVTAAEAVRLVRDGDWVVVEGFVGQCFAEELTLALEQRFLLTGAPRDLGLVFTVAAGNRQGRGLDRLCHEGLLGRAVGGHWGLSPGLGKMAVDNKIEAHNLPQGVISQLFRGLKDDLLTIPLEARFAYDAERNIFFLNMEGMSLTSADDIEAIGTAVGTRLVAIGKKVQMVVNYDNFYVDPALTDDYISGVRWLAERYYASATRYTTSSFMRLKLTRQLHHRDLARTSMKAAKKP